MLTKRVFHNFVGAAKLRAERKYEVHNTKTSTDNQTGVSTSQKRNCYQYFRFGKVIQIKVVNIKLKVKMYFRY